VISLIVDSKPEGLLKSFFSYLEEALIKSLSFSGQIEVIFIDIEQIRQINKQYRNKDYPTDVLSFNLDSEGIVGQVFVCYDIALEQSKEHKWSIENEVALLITHGVLHIYGYDHENQDDFEKMREMENQILNLMEFEGYEEKS
jgi:probable rRNA maturation factor